MTPLDIAEAPSAIPAPPVLPNHVRYIKLGTGGQWANYCFENDELHFGDNSEPHDLCLTGDWEGARRYMIETLGRAPGPAKNLRRLRKRPACRRRRLLSNARSTGPISAASSEACETRPSSS
jgi:hypothetical protein